MCIARYTDFELKIYSKIVGILCDSDDVYWGTDTTATTLELAMSLLLNHPEILKKVKVEIDSQVGHGRLINDLDISKLPYLRCVLNEALRLYPTSPFITSFFLNRLHRGGISYTTRDDFVGECIFHE